MVRPMAAALQRQASIKIGEEGHAEAVSALYPKEQGMLLVGVYEILKPPAQHTIAKSLHRSGEQAPKPRLLALVLRPETAGGAETSQYRARLDLFKFSTQGGKTQYDIEKSITLANLTSMSVKEVAFASSRTQRAPPSPPYSRQYLISLTLDSGKARSYYSSQEKGSFVAKDETSRLRLCSLIFNAIKLLEDRETSLQGIHAAEMQSWWRLHEADPDVAAVLAAASKDGVVSAQDGETAAEEGAAGAMGRALLSEDEERDLEELMGVFDMGVSSLGTFRQRLQQELVALEAANVHATLEGGDLASRVAHTIQVSEGSLEDLEQWLGIFNVKLKHMQGDVSTIEAWNNLLETQSQNHRKLLERISELLNITSFDQRQRAMLTAAPLEPRLVPEIVAAGWELDSALRRCRPNPALAKIGPGAEANAETSKKGGESSGDPPEGLPPELAQVAFIREFRSDMAAVRDAFVHRAAEAVRGRVSALVNMATARINAKAAPSIGRIFADLNSFAPLVPLLTTLDSSVSISLQHSACAQLNTLLCTYLAALTASLRAASEDRPPADSTSGQPPPPQAADQSTGFRLVPSAQPMLQRVASRKGAQRDDWDAAGLQSMPDAADLLGDADDGELHATALQQDALVHGALERFVPDLLLSCRGVLEVFGSANAHDKAAGETPRASRRDTVDTHSADGSPMHSGRSATSPGGRTPSEHDRALLTALTRGLPDEMGRALSIAVARDALSGLALAATFSHWAQRLEGDRDAEVVRDFVQISGVATRQLLERAAAAQEASLGKVLPPRTKQGQSRVLPALVRFFGLARRTLSLLDEHAQGRTGAAGAGPGSPSSPGGGSGRAAEDSPALRPPVIRVTLVGGSGVSALERLAAEAWVSAPSAGGGAAASQRLREGLGLPPGSSARREKSLGQLQFVASFTGLSSPNTPPRLLADRILVRLAAAVFTSLEQAAAADKKRQARIRLENYAFATRHLEAIAQSSEPFDGVLRACRAVEDACQRDYVGHLMDRGGFAPIEAKARGLEALVADVGEAEVVFYPGMSYDDVVDVLAPALRGAERRLQSLREKVEQHLETSSPALIERVWGQLRERLVGCVRQLEDLVQRCHGEQLRPSPEEVEELFRAV
ncbi:unnamed protein product [Pedinophyceae sp. YPF-701]|nr:unnamed protein product [Pedinophyceae sp. YPF-701]